MRIINIVDNVDPLNIGLWNSITINNRELEQYGVKSELWFPRAEFDDSLMTPVKLDNLSNSELEKKRTERKLDPATDVIVTHGIWKYPSRWGRILGASGFRWICVPHGMLEPWPLQQKWLKKQLYFRLIEKQNITKANLIRAVSKPEKINLDKQFRKNQIRFIPNGVAIDKPDSGMSEFAVKSYLFLSRLHHKKNVTALVKGWIQSNINNNKNFELLIAGPDQGELKGLLPLIAQSTNIRYLGAIFGVEKEAVFKRSTFFVLPSFSEGLPSSLLEAMAYGLVPLITTGCNFPDVFEKNLGKIISTDHENIRNAIDETSSWEKDDIFTKSEKCKELIVSKYSINAVTETMIKIYFEGMPQPPL